MRGNRGTKHARNHTARHQQSPKLVPDPCSSVHTTRFRLPGANGTWRALANRVTAWQQASNKGCTPIYRHLAARPGQSAFHSGLTSRCTGQGAGRTSHHPGNAARHSDLPAESVLLPAAQSRHGTARRARAGWPRDQG